MQTPNQALFVVTDLKFINKLASKGIIKSFDPFTYVDTVNDVDMFYYKGSVYVMRYVSGCFYPYLFRVSTDSPIRVHNDNVTFNFVGVAGPYTATIVRF